MITPNIFAVSHAGTRMIGDAREVRIKWVSHPHGQGWVWHCLDTDYMSVTYDTSEEAYRSALNTIG